MIGILLAGGAATRLPNKPLLPQKKHLEPVCFSGMDYLIRHNVDRIDVVVPKDSVLVDIIQDSYWDINLNFVYQGEPTGVGDAINLVRCDEQLGLIVMGDNIYPENEIMKLYEPITNIAGPFVTVRKVPSWRLPHLVRVDQYGRLTRTGPGNLALTTPWCVTVGNGMCSPEAWEDLHGVDKIEMPSEGWWDVGTVETYTAYWRSK